MPDAPLPHDEDPVDPSLRAEAESRIARHAPGEEDFPEDAARLIHELRVHQEELRLQNAELREAQVQLEQARRRYYELFDLAPVGYALIDAQGLVQEINLAVAEALGADRRLLARKPFSIYVASADQTTFYRHLRGVFDDHEKQVCEIELRRGGGALFPARLESSPLQSSVRRAPLCLTAILDLTDRKQAEEALIRSEQMAALGTLAAGISHEFNNIHSGALGMLEMLLERDDVSPWAAERLGRLKSLLTRSATVTEQLLGFAGRRQARFLPASVNEIVRETLQILEGDLAADGIEVEHDLDPVPHCLVDPGQIGQVIMNLLINARHALLDAPQRRIRIATEADGRMVRLTVADSGPGVPAADRVRIFQPFFTTKGEHAAEESPLREVRGTGLGLSVSQTIVTNHGGEIDLEADEDGGARFVIRLPASISQTPVAEAPLPVEPPADPQPLRVLVVDDEAVLREMVCDYLEAHGLEAEEVRDGESALRRLGEAAFDAVLLDWQMPGMNGGDLLQRLPDFGEAGRPAFLVHTGRMEKIQSVDWRALGADALIEKPAPPSRILAELRRVAQRPRVSGG